ncbi:radical SAM family heme chaperone HemW [Berryella wangjianweii]|uniref:Heme chaperone HemW n=1 Tax=Berryella wangjianweii TaxID=2734634 RepID=A0A6M8J5P3_9ACTN|nr:radical SAM family heme chaperone HemW [Berryella wangjianweii]QKF06998.1 radical SAM family heme chaperone HemW [Berryella wangjianweii]
MSPEKDSASRAPQAAERGVACAADEAIDRLGPLDPVRALYVHVPFCASRCRYCDFPTQAAPANDPRMGDYVEGLVMELFRRSRAGELADVRTVYLGGGTPSHLGIRHLSSLLYALSLCVSLSRDDMECSMEANPESLSERMVLDMWAMGVNRLSIGVQSLDDDVLRLLGRPHDADAALRAIDAAHLRFENVSCDLMCGIPGQSARTLVRDVERVVAAGVSHVSVYPLAIEEGTALERMVARGELLELGDDEQAEHMEAAHEALEAAGLARYEVASYARPGFACRHNIAYWTGVPYRGIGAGAASMLQGSAGRVRLTDGCVTDELSMREAVLEDVMLGMRLAAGIADEEAARACASVPALGGVLERLRAQGLVEVREGRVRPTRRGWLCGNELYGAILECPLDPLDRPSH